MVWIICLGLLGAILAGAIAAAWKWWILAQAGVDPSTLPAFQLLFDVMNLHWPALAGGGGGAVIGAVLSRLTRPPPAAPAPPPLERELQYVHFRGEADDNIHAGQRQRADEWLARHGRDRQDDDDPR